MSKNDQDSAKYVGNSKTLQIVVSIVIAFFIWLVSMLAAPEITRTIRNVPIQVGVPSAESLVVVEGQGSTVTVVLDGKQYEIGSYSANDIKVVADLSDVSGAGSYDVPLTVTGENSQNYSVTSITPSTVNLTFENQMSSDFKVETDISGLNIPDGFVSPSDEITVEPSTVHVSGAESVVSRISRAVVKVSFDKQVNTSQKISQEIVYYDAYGNTVDLDKTAGVSANATSANVTIPVKKVATLPLTLSFLNIPDAFPIDQLSYTISSQNLTVAAEESTIKNYSSLTLGYIDFKQFNLASSGEISFDVTLPSGFTNINGISSVNVTFNNTNIGSSYLSLKNFQIVNAPSNFDVAINDGSLRALVVGDKTVLKSIASGDFVVQLDLADTDLKSGNTTLPVSIYAPTKGLVWAVGDYNVNVTVKAK